MPCGPQQTIAIVGSAGKIDRSHSAAKTKAEALAKAAAFSKAMRAVEGVSCPPQCRAKSFIYDETNYVAESSILWEGQSTSFTTAQSGEMSFKIGQPAPADPANTVPPNPQSRIAGYVAVGTQHAKVTPNCSRGIVSVRIGTGSSGTSGAGGSSCGLVEDKIEIGAEPGPAVHMYALLARAEEKMRKRIASIIEAKSCPDNCSNKVSFVQITQNPTALPSPTDPQESLVVRYSFRVQVYCLQDGEFLQTTGTSGGGGIGGDGSGSNDEGDSSGSGHGAADPPAEEADQQHAVVDWLIDELRLSSWGDDS
jgi:hypothetical protein